MRDLIWTIIGIWMVYRIVTAIQSMGRQNNQTKVQDQPRHQPNAQKNPLRDEGEYVDFEEIK